MAFPSILGFCASVDRKQKIRFREIRTSRVNIDCVSFLEILPGCLSERAPRATKVWSLRRESLSRLLWWLRDRAVAAPPFCRARSVSRRLLFAAVGVPRFDPGPEGEGGRVQNAGRKAASVGRRQFAGGSLLGFRAQINARRISSSKKVV